MKREHDEDFEQNNNSNGEKRKQHNDWMNFLGVVLKFHG